MKHIKLYKTYFMGNVNKAMLRMKQIHHVDELDGVDSSSLKIINNPLELSDVLETIVAFLDWPTLKSARSVSAQWREEATREFLARGFLRVPHNYFDSKTNNIFSTLPKFVPSQVRHLQINDERDIPIFRKMNVIGSSSSADGSESFNKTKTLEYNSWPDENLSKLLREMPWLSSLTKKNGYGFEATFLQILIPLRLTHLVKSVYFAPELLPGDSEIFEKTFVSAPGKRSVRLCQFTINLNYIISTPQRWSQVTKMVQNVFDLSKKSMEELRVESPLGSFSQLSIPKLANLKILRLILHLQSQVGRPLNFYSVFPPNFKFLENMPALQTVEMRISWDQNVSLLLGGVAAGGSAPHVTNLVLDGPSAPTFIVTEDFVSFFPNLIKLSCINVQYFEGLAKILWKFCRLQCLELGLDSGFNTNRYPLLDSFLTGLAPDLVDRLRTGDFEDEAEKKEILNKRRGPSVLDLKDLRQLQINFFNLRSYGPFAPFLLSEVTPQYAFSLMPSLKVTIEVRDFDDGCEKREERTKGLRKSLESLSKFPNVEIIP